MWWKSHVQFLEGENLVKDLPISTDPSSFTAFSYCKLNIKILSYIIKGRAYNKKLISLY